MLGVDPEASVKKKKSGCLLVVVSSLKAIRDNFLPVLLDGQAYVGAYHFGYQRLDTWLAIARVIDVTLGVE